MENGCFLPIFSLNTRGIIFYCWFQKSSHLWPLFPKKQSSLTKKVVTSDRFFQKSVTSDLATHWNTRAWSILKHAINIVLHCGLQNTAIGLLVQQARFARLYCTWKLSFFQSAAGVGRVFRLAIESKGFQTFCVFGNTSLRYLIPGRYSAVTLRKFWCCR
jgi:hypothetical protein